MIATGLLAGALVSLGQMFAMSVASNRSAQAASVATTLAIQKMEQLRGLTFGFDASGMPLTDVSSATAAAVEAPTGGTGLSSSPAGSLTSNAEGWVDYVDQAGNVLGGGATAPPTALYVRRWAITPLPAHPQDGILIQVAVIGLNVRGEARLVCVRTRKAS